MIILSIISSFYKCKDTNFLWGMPKSQIWGQIHFLEGFFWWDCLAQTIPFQATMYIFT